MSSQSTPATSRLGWVSIALIALIVTLLALGVWLFLRWKDARDKQPAYAEAIAAARAETQAFTTLDYRNVDTSTKRVLDGATGTFKKQFGDQRGSIAKLSRTNKSVSRGSISSAGVVSMDKDSARVIVVADSQVSNVNTRTPQPRHYRLQVDLVLRNGQWLTSDLQFVG